MIKKITVTIRNMTARDIPEAMNLKAKEGWNQTARDWELLIADPKNICIAAETGNKIIGTAAAFNYDHYLAWISMVIVDSAFRGLGVGMKMLHHLIKKLSGCKAIKLDATPAGKKIYEKIGFCGEYKIYRWIHPGINHQDFPNDKIPLFGAKKKDIPEITAFDRQIFGVNRRKLISYFLNNYPGPALLSKKNHRITGYALGRPGSNYFQLGPVCALTFPEAKALISQSLENIRNRPVVIDVPEHQTRLQDWLESLGFNSQRFFIRMYYKTNPFPGEIHNQFAIGGPEYG